MIEKGEGLREMKSLYRVRLLTILGQVRALLNYGDPMPNPTLEELEAIRSTFALLRYTIERAEECLGVEVKED